MDSKILRTIDANINRATEGLRVAEDIFRYHLDNKDFQARLKSLRHKIMAAFCDDIFVAHREPTDDVGFASNGELEYQRLSTKDTIRSNMKRAEEALRVLEEVCKIENQATSLVMKEIRYEIYQIEKEIYISQTKPVLNPGLYLILTNPPKGYPEMTRLAVQANIPVVQLRYKGDNDGEFFDIACEMRKITSGTSTVFIVNDRVDIAVLSEADGVHLGQNNIDPFQAKKIFGEDKIIGFSTHTLDQVRLAQTFPIDYIGFGPIWPTTSKAKPDPVTGIDALKEAVEISKHPVVAIGGITKERIKEISGIKCNNVAVITAVSETDDPYTEMEAVNTQFLEQR